MFDKRTSQQENLEKGRGGWGGVGVAHNGINTLNLRNRKAHSWGTATKQQKSVSLKVPLSSHFSVCCWDFFILVSLGLSVPAESFSFVLLWALRQSCTEWWLSVRIAAQPAAGPPWLVNSRVSKGRENQKRFTQCDNRQLRVNQWIVRVFLPVPKF